MATDEEDLKDLKEGEVDEPVDESSLLSEKEETVPAALTVVSEEALRAKEEEKRELFANAGGPVTTTDGDGAPVQLGTSRFVAAAYFAFGILIAFMAFKVVGYGWERLFQWKGAGNEAYAPKDELVMGLAAVVGVAISLYCFRDKTIRKMIEEIAGELAKVSWPTKQEVTSNTIVVFVTTLIATGFFSAMDWIWGQVTNKIYGM